MYSEQVSLALVQAALLVSEAQVPVVFSLTRYVSVYCQQSL
jgi:hypothetical protein